MQEKCVKFAAHDCVAELVDPIKGIVTVESERGSITTSYSFFVNLQTALETIPEFKKNFETPDNDDYVYYLECTGASRKFELSMLAVMEGSAVMKSHLENHLRIFVLPYSFDMPIDMVREIVDNFQVNPLSVNPILLIPNVEEDCNYYEYYKKDRLEFKKYRFENYFKVLMGQLSEAEFIKGLVELIPESQIVQLDSEANELFQPSSDKEFAWDKPILVIKKNDVYFNPQSQGEPLLITKDVIRNYYIPEVRLQNSTLFKK